MSSKKHGRLKQTPTMATSESFHPDSPSKVTHTIDLHGYRKSAAISKLTSFLDQVVSGRNGGIQRDVWVLVITGSGAHSHEGPVLRGAVESLFEKRRMTYKLLPGRASFMVNAASGIILYEPDQPCDTKVVVTDSESVAAKNNRVGAGDRWVGIMKTSTNGTSLRQDDDARESGNALKNAFRDQKNEEYALRKALSISLVEKVKNEEEEEEVLRRAVSLSVIENKQEIEEVEQLQQMIQQSELELQLESEAEANLLRAIELSQNECREEENELLKALEQSMLDF